MLTVVLLLIVWVPYFVARALRANHVRRLNENHPRSADAMPEALGETGDGNRGRSAWSALDDHQLTRLLTDSAPRTATE